MRSDFRAAQAVLDLMPESAAGLGARARARGRRAAPDAGVRRGRIADAVRYAEAADRLFADRRRRAPRRVAGRHHLAVLDRDVPGPATARRCGTSTASVGVARATGQSYIMSNLLAGQARRPTSCSAGSTEATAAAEDAAETAPAAGLGAATGVRAHPAVPGRELGRRRRRRPAPRRRGRRRPAAAASGGARWHGTPGRMALINAGDAGRGRAALLEACDDFKAPRLDLGTLMLLLRDPGPRARPRGRSPRGRRVGRAGAEQRALADAETDHRRGPLARAHVLAATDPAGAAEHATRGGRGVHRRRAAHRRGPGHDARRHRLRRGRRAPRRP